MAATAAMAVAGFAAPPPPWRLKTTTTSPCRRPTRTPTPCTSLHRRSKRRHAEQYQAGQNFNKNNTANKSAADAAAEIAQGTYADNTAKLAAITPYVDLAGTAYGEVSAKTALSAPAGYYLLKDKDAVTGNDAATLFIVQVNGPVTVNRKADKRPSKRRSRTSTTPLVIRPTGRIPPITM